MKAKDIDDYEELLESADIEAVSDWDMNFVSDMKEKFSRYGDDCFVSSSQYEQLLRISGEA